MNFVQVSVDHGADLKTGPEAEAEASNYTALQAATLGGICQENSS